MPPFNKSRDAAQNAAQAIRELEMLSQEITALKDDLAQTRFVLQGLWELFKEKTGVTDEELTKLVGSLEERLISTPREAESCPSCSRPLQDRSKACIYCGALVKIRRLF